MNMPAQDNAVRNATAPEAMALREKWAELVEQLPPDRVTVATLLDLIGREGLLLLCVFLTLPFMVPVSIPGVSTVFGATILLIGISLVLDRRPWLPTWIMKREFSAAKLRTALTAGKVWIDRLERISRPRLIAFTHAGAMARVHGLALVLGALLLMAPFGLVPLTNTLPGMAILFLAVGILQRDGWIVLLGHLTNLVTIIYFALLIGTGTLAVREAIARVMAWLS